MPTTLPGETPTTLPTPDLPGSQPQPTPPQLPGTWNDWQRVFADVVALAAKLEPVEASEVWREYKRLSRG